ncbi:hypothetical protein COP1_031817 [Malus domestica]
MIVCRSRNLGDLVVEMIEQQLCLCQICCHGAILSVKVVGDLVNHQLEVNEYINSFNPKVLAKRKPARKASYSASLFDTLNLKRRAYSIATLLGVVRTSHAPQPCWLDEPSTYRLHVGAVGSIL